MGEALKTRSRKSATALVGLSSVTYVFFSVWVQDATLAIIIGFPLGILSILILLCERTRLLALTALIYSTPIIILSLIIIIIGYESSELFGILYLLFIIPTFISGLTLLKAK